MSGAIARTQADEILEQGQEKGMNNAMALFSFLFDNGRVEEAQKASKDPGLFRKLMDQYVGGIVESEMNSRRQGTVLCLPQLSLLFGLVHCGYLQDDIPGAITPRKLLFLQEQEAFIFQNRKESLIGN